MNYTVSRTFLLILPAGALSWPNLRLLKHRLAILPPSLETYFKLFTEFSDASVTLENVCTWLLQQQEKFFDFLLFSMVSMKYMVHGKILK